MASFEFLNYRYVEETDRLTETIINEELSTIQETIISRWGLPDPNKDEIQGKGITYVTEDGEFTFTRDELIKIVKCFGLRDY